MSMFCFLTSYLNLFRSQFVSYNMNSLKLNVSKASSQLLERPFLPSFQPSTVAVWFWGCSHLLCFCSFSRVSTWKTCRNKNKVAYSITPSICNGIFYSYQSRFLNKVKKNKAAIGKNSWKYAMEISNFNHEVMVWKKKEEYVTNLLKFKFSQNVTSLRERERERACVLSWEDTIQFCLNCFFTNKCVISSSHLVHLLTDVTSSVCYA